MRTHYTYEIALPTAQGWNRVVRENKWFSREPASVVRGLLEQWIISHPNQLPSGRIVVTDTARRVQVPEQHASVRILLYTAGQHSAGRMPAAVSYLIGIDCERPRTRPARRDAAGSDDHSAGPRVRRAAPGRHRR